jgi:hypothetical protein
MVSPFVFGPVVLCRAVAARFLTANFAERITRAATLVLFPGDSLTKLLDFVQDRIGYDVHTWQPTEFSHDDPVAGGTDDGSRRNVGHVRTWSRLCVS